MGNKKSSFSVKSILITLLLCSMCWGNVDYTHFVPITDDTLDVGIERLRWRYLHLSRDADIEGDVLVGGNLIGGEGFQFGSASAYWKANEASNFLTTPAGTWLGLGTDTPDEILSIGTVNDNEDHFIQLATSSGFDSGIFFYEDGVGTGMKIIYDGGDSKLYFYGGASVGTQIRLVTFERGGNVGINTDNPITKIQAVGDARFGDYDTNYTQFSDTGDISQTGSATASFNATTITGDLTLTTGNLIGPNDMTIGSVGTPGAITIASDGNILASGTMVWSGGGSANANAAYSHISADGSSHSFLDQAVLIASTPTLAGLIIADGGTIGQADGPLLTFDDTNNFMEITGCNTGFGIAIPTKIIQVRGSGDSGGFNHGNWQAGFGKQSKGEVLIGTYEDQPAIQGHGSGTAFNLLLNPTAGNVGINTTTPDTKLQVVGNTRFGDDDTNYQTTSSTGDTHWVGSAGLLFGEIYGYDENTELTVSGSGIGNKIQVTTLTVNGNSNGITPDHTNDHLTIATAGMYMCNVSMVIESVGAGGADKFGFGVFKNNGTGQFTNIHSHRTLSGGGGDTGSVTMSGIIDLAVSDTIEVWLWNENSTDNIIIDDVTLTLFQIGGT